MANIFDPLVTFDYTARPYKLVPNTVTTMPTISADGKVFTFKIKPGIFFADHPAFGGKKRELTAADYVYSIKRLLDPTMNSPHTSLVAGKFFGADEVVKAAGKGPLNYDTPIEGIKALDKYTLQITLTNTDHNFLANMAGPSMSAVAREVVSAGGNTNATPVGTGPYRLKEWKLGHRIALEANPGYRKVTFKGKPVPAIGNIDVSVIQEEQPRWLAFLNKQVDFTAIPQVALMQALDIDPTNPLQVKLKPEFTSQGMQLHRLKGTEITFSYFNMNDPLVGGYATEKVALRRAIAMAFPRAEAIAKIRRGQAVPVRYLVPEGLNGHNPKFNAEVKYDRAAANALLDKFDYKIGADGFRTLPDGKPLVVEYATGSTAIDKQWNEFWQESFDSLKIKLKWKQAQWNEHLKDARAGKLQMWGLAWSAGNQDGQSFMKLLHSKTIGDINFANFKNAEYDKAYEASEKLPHGAERNKLYDRMNQIAAAQQPLILGDTRIGSTLTHKYVKNFVPHHFINQWRYLDIQK